MLHDAKNFMRYTQRLHLFFLFLHLLLPYTAYPLYGVKANMTNKKGKMKRKMLHIVCGAVSRLYRHKKRVSMFFKPKDFDN